MLIASRDRWQACVPARARTSRWIIKCASLFGIRPCRNLVLGLRLRHLCFIVSLTRFQTRGLERSTSPGTHPHTVDFDFLGCPLSLPLSASSQILNTSLGIMGLNFLVSSTYKLLSVCSLNFNSVCTVLILSVV